MNEQIVRAATGSVSWRQSMPWLIGAGVYVLLILSAGRLLNDPDSYWHLAVGRWIVAHGAVPHVDPFSHTMSGAHWIAFEWLSEVLYAAAFATSGWMGVVVLAAASIALAFGLLTRLLLRDLGVVPVLAVTMVALVLLSPHLLARPHVLALPLMVAWAGALVRAMDDRLGPPFAALPLLVLWANLHGSVSLGVALIGPAALEALWWAGRGRWRDVGPQWLLFAALAVVAASITPYGPGTLLVPLSTLGLGDALAIIVEWRPQDFSTPGAFELVLLSAMFALSRGVALPPMRVLVMLGLIHLALAQSRHVDVLAMLAPLYLARPIARQYALAREPDVAVPSAPPLEHFPEKWTPVFRKEMRQTSKLERFPLTAGDISWPTVSESALGIVAGVIAAAALATGIALGRDVAPDPRMTPQAAIVAADLAAAGPVLNDYAFGGYLIYAGIPPFIDGRGELYGGTFISRHHRAMTLQDLPDLLKLLDEYHIGATLLAPSTPAVALLDRWPGWKRVYADDVAVVHQRAAGAGPR